MQAIATFQVGYCAFADKGNGRSTTRESVLCLPCADHGHRHSVRTTHCPWPEAACYLLSRSGEAGPRAALLGPVRGEGWVTESQTY